MSRTSINSQPRSSGRRRRVSTKQQKKRERFQEISFRLLAFLGVCGLIGLIGYLLLSPTFYLNSLAVSTTDSVLSDKLTTRLSEELSRKISYVPLRNRFLWTRQRLDKIISRDFPEIENFTVAIKDNELFVKVTPYRPVLTWCPPTVIESINNRHNCFGVNKNGEVFSSELVGKDGHDALVVTDEYVYPEPGDRVLRPKLVTGILDLTKSLGEVGYEISLVKVDYDNIQLVTTLGESALIQIDAFLLPISTDSVFALATKDLLLVLEQEELANIANRENIAKYEIVDLTSPNKVFYTFKKYE